MWHIECCVAARRWLRKQRRWRTVFWLFLQGVIQKEADHEKSLCCQKADGEPLFRVVISALFTIWQVSPPSPHLLPPLASPSLINLDWVAWSTCQRLLINLWHLRVPETDSASRLRGFHRVSHIGSEEERSARLRWKKWDFRGQNENAKRPRYVTPLSVWMRFPWQQKCSMCHGWALLSRWRKLWKEAVSTLETKQRAGFIRETVRWLMMVYSPCRSLLWANRVNFSSIFSLNSWQVKSKSL